MYTATPTSVSHSAGSSRRNRRRQNARRLIDPLRSCSPTSSSVIRYPLMTKNTSTPRNPPGNQVWLAW